MKFFNANQFWSLVRGAFKAGGGALVANGVDQASIKQWVTGAILAIIGFIFSHLTHAETPSSSSTGTVSGTVTPAK